MTLPTPMTLLMAFIGGALICFAVQLLIDLTRLTPARILVMLVTLGVVLFALGLWEPLTNIFGYGLRVPLLGFGATIAEGVKKAVDEIGLFGAFSGGLSASAAGITVSLFIATLLSLFFGGKRKKM